MTVSRANRTRPTARRHRAVMMLAALLAITAHASPLAPVAAQAPPAVTAASATDAPPDPVISEAARRLSLGRDLLAVLGDRLTAQHVEEDAKRAELDGLIANLGWRRRVRQSLLEKIAVDTSDLIGTKRDHQRHVTNMVDLLQGSLFSVATGTQLLMIDPLEASKQQ